jgi:hypothetical protein
MFRRNLLPYSSEQKDKCNVEKGKTIGQGEPELAVNQVLFVNIKYWQKCIRIVKKII